MRGHRVRSCNLVVVGFQDLAPRTAHDRHLPGKPDLIFAGRRKVVFVHGCFWHGHEGCRYGSLPKTRLEFWQEKIARNRKRDREAVEALLADGWSVMVVW